jgi:hypothetical protein
MTTREQILADSTSLLKDDPAVAAAMFNPAPPGSRPAKKIKAVASIANKLTPPLNSPPVDPCGTMQRAISSVLNGVGGKGPSLGSVVDLTNRRCSMTRTFHLLREMLASVTDIADMRAGAYSDWSPEQAAALDDHLPRAGRGLVYVGYRIDAPRLRNAVDELADLEREPMIIDARHSLVHACYRLVFSIIRQLRGELDAAGNDWLELRPDEAACGRYTIRTIAPPSD